MSNQFAARAVSRFGVPSAWDTYSLRINLRLRTAFHGCPQQSAQVFGSGCRERLYGFLPLSIAEATFDQVAKEEEHLVVVSGIGNLLQHFACQIVAGGVRAKMGIASHRKVKGLSFSRAGWQIGLVWHRSGCTSMCCRLKVTQHQGVLLGGSSSLTVLLALLVSFLPTSACFV